jgi:antitoxin CcdA
MQRASHRTPPKAATNVSISRDLLAAAKAANINLSATLESALAARLRLERQHQWRTDNHEAIEKYNEHVADSGVYSDSVRKF